MNVKRKLENSLVDLFDRIKVWNARNWEKRKYTDKRRKEIWSKILLTKEQKERIDRLYKGNYGKIPHTWHRHYTAFTGKFDEKYFPELLFIPEFERFMNSNAEYARVMEDKNILPVMYGLSCKNTRGGYIIPRSIISCTFGVYRNSDFEFISKDEALSVLQDAGKVFAKPSVGSSSGRGCFSADFHGGMDAMSKSSVKEMFDALGSNFIVQERIVCHSSIAKLYDGAVNTFRVITYRWKEEIVVLPVIMRIGRGGNYLDNAHAGGMFIAVDDDGTLHEKAFTEFKQEFTCHPDSGTVFKGYRIEHFEKVPLAAKNAHSLIPQLGVINWDFTIDESGTPVLVEANVIGGGIWLIQMAHGKGVFGERTAEILRWLRFVKAVPRSKREPYLFGVMPK